MMKMIWMMNLMINNTLVTNIPSKPDEERSYFYYVIIQGDSYG